VSCRRIAASVGLAVGLRAPTPAAPGPAALLAQEAPDSATATPILRPANPPAAVVAAARTFRASDDPRARETAAAWLRAADVPVDVLVAALAADPGYAADVPRGRLDRMRVGGDGRVYPYVVLIPPGYRPDRVYPVLVYLHGGVGRAAWDRPGAWWRDYDRIADADRIVVVPAAWNEAEWWQDRQVDNLAAILRTLSRRYRIDHDRVHLLGISDGGTGVYFQAFRAATPWASFLSFIGHPAVLSSPRLPIDGQMYVGNLRNRPLFALNGGRDRLYPAASVEPYLRLFRDDGVTLVYRPRPDAGHDTSWWDEESARIDSFIVATPRDPLPDRLEWETEDPRRGRFSWLVIDELGPVAGEAALPDRNELRIPGESEPYLAFPHPRPSGRVELERVGNEVTARTRGVRAFRLLISPAEFDVARPVRVTVNGRIAFDGLVEPGAGPLLEWAARDLDPGLLFVAEIEVRPGG